MPRCSSALSVLVPILCWVTFVVADPTTCMTSNRRSEVIDPNSLHFVCYCNSASNPPTSEVAAAVAENDFFSLADFAYHLSGRFFSKAVFIRFNNCRYLRLRLDQHELSRIGSRFFRPDIQIRGLTFNNIYHLDLTDDPDDDPAAEKEAEEAGLVQFPTSEMLLSATAVALIRVERGARFTSLISASNATRLFIDLTAGKGGGNGAGAARNGVPNESDFNVRGFSRENTFFLTGAEKRVPLEKVRIQSL